MRIRTARFCVAAVVSAPLAAALLADPKSPCAMYCGNSLSSTARDEMVCDSAGLATSAGKVWQHCIRCMLTSTSASGHPTDLQSLLYNLRFNVEYCLFEAPSNPCITSRACEPLRDGFDYQNLSTAVQAYDYCTKWDETAVPTCQPCLQLLPNGMYAYNYMMILEAACEQTPTPGSTISIQGDPFSTNPVVIVPPSPTYPAVQTPDYGPVSLGARVGIAFGGLAFILALTGFCIVCKGKRRRRAFLRELERRHGTRGWPHPKTRYGGGGPDMFETPVSQRPLRSWENESPVSAQTDGPYPRYFSPYSSQFNSPVMGSDGVGPSAANWSTMPSQQQLDQTMMQQQSPAIGGDAASLWSKTSNLDPNAYPVHPKGKQRDEAYEMHEVESPNGNGDGRQNEYPYGLPAEPQAPVLHHPGHGRQQRSRPGSGGEGGAVAGAGGVINIL